MDEAKTAAQVPPETVDVWRAGAKEPRVPTEVAPPAGSVSRAHLARLQADDPWVGKIPWRAQQPTPVFLPGESHGQRSLAGYSP